MNFVEKTILFNETAGNAIAYDARKVSLYIGLMLEELGETVIAFNNNSQDLELIEICAHMKQVADKFKQGTFDHLADYADHVEVSDGFGDCAVVAVGGLMSNGYEPVGVLHNIADSNLSKFYEAGDETKTIKVIKDENGKIKKNTGYFKPSLAQFKV